jgi:hypothetical protein
MTNDQGIPSGVEDTSTRDPLLHLAAAMGGLSGYIEGMEADGQRQLVNSTMLPTRMNSGTDDDLRALGFELGDPDPADPVFRPATLPGGWEKRRTDHSMWSEVVDELGRKRLSIFYKAAFYDRSAFINIQTISGYAYDVIHGSPLVLDGEWATGEAMRSAVQEYRDDLAGRAERYADEDGYYAEQIANADRVLTDLDSGTASC